MKKSFQYIALIALGAILFFVKSNFDARYTISKKPLKAPVVIAGIAFPTGTIANIIGDEYFDMTLAAPLNYKGQLWPVGSVFNLYKDRITTIETNNEMSLFGSKFTGEIEVFLLQNEIYFIRSKNEVRFANILWPAKSEFIIKNNYIHEVKNSKKMQFKGLWFAKNTDFNFDKSGKFKNIYLTKRHKLHDGIYEKSTYINFTPEGIKSKLEKKEESKQIETKKVIPLDLLKYEIKGLYSNGCKLDVLIDQPYLYSNKINIPQGSLITIDTHSFEIIKIKLSKDFKHKGVSYRIGEEITLDSKQRVTESQFVASEVINIHDSVFPKGSIVKRNKKGEYSYIEFEKNSNINGVSYAKGIFSVHNNRLVEAILNENKKIDGVVYPKNTSIVYLDGKVEKFRTLRAMKYKDKSLDKNTLVYILDKNDSLKIYPDTDPEYWWEEEV